MSDRLEKPIAQRGPVALSFRGGQLVTVTRRMVEVLPRLRNVLVDVAAARGTITYREACAAIDAYTQQSVGRLLDVLDVDCELRGEPRLAGLVVSATTGEVGAGFAGDGPASRVAAYAFWSSARPDR